MFIYIASYDVLMMVLSINIHFKKDDCFSSFPNDVEK